MRILLLAQFYAPIVGGEERMVETLATGLRERGHKVAVATLHQPGQAELEHRDGVAIHRLPGTAQRFAGLFSEPERRHAPPAPDPETVRALRRVLERERPDVVHGHNWLDAAYLPLAGRAAAAFVVSLHDYSLICANKRLMFEGQPCTGPAAVKCARCAAAQYGVLSGPPIAALTRLTGARRRRVADLFLPVSAYVAERCGLAAAATPFEVIPNFLAELSGPEPAPAPGGLPDGDFMLFVGDLTRDKGVDVLLRAHRAMDTAPPLVLIGRRLDEVSTQGHPDVIALGPLPHAQVLAAWERAAVGVAPSITPETFGLAALEAMRAGTPVVAARSGGLPEVIEDGVSGLLVAPGDVDGLRDALERLTSDAGLRERVGGAARLRAERFTPAAILPRVEAAYDRALAHRAAPRTAR